MAVFYITKCTYNFCIFACVPVAPDLYLFVGTMHILQMLRKLD